MSESGPLTAASEPLEAAIFDALPEHLWLDEPKVRQARRRTLAKTIAARLTTATVAAARAASYPSRTLDVERLRTAVVNVRDMDPLDYLDRGDESDAIAAEYDRLATATVPAEPAASYTNPVTGRGVATGGNIPLRATPAAEEGLREATWRLSNAAESLAHHARHPDDEGHRSWFRSAIGDVEREVHQARKAAGPEPTPDEYRAALGESNR